MKKYVAMLLSVIMLLCFCACHNDSPTIKDGDSSTKAANSVPSQFAGKLLEPYIKIILSGTYMYEATSPDNMPVTYAKSGTDKVLTTCTVEGTPLTLMKMNGKYYIAFSSNKMYMEATQEYMENYGFSTTIAALSLDNLTSASYVGAGTETLNEAEYKYEDYYNPLNQITNRFYFDADGNLKYLAKVDTDGKVSAPSTMNLYTVSDTVFNVINDYQLVDPSSTAPAATTAAKK